MVLLLIYFLTSINQSSAANTAHKSNALDVDKIDTDITEDVQAEDPGISSNMLDSAFDSWYFHSPFFYKKNFEKFKIHNDLKLGFLFTSGNTRSYVISGLEKIVFSKGKIVNHLKGGASYSQSSTTPDTPPSEDIRFLFVKNKLEWHFYRKIYSFASVGWFSDKPSGYHHNFNTLLGLGYFFIDKENVIFRIEGSYSYNYEDLVAPNPSQSLHSVLGGLRFYWKIKKWMSFNNELDAIENLRNGKDFRINLESDLKFLIIKHLYFGIGFNLRYDNRPVTGYKKTDTSLSASIGFTI